MEVATIDPIMSWDKGAVAEFAMGSDDVLVLPRKVMDSLGPRIEAGRVNEYLAQVDRKNGAFEVRSGLSELKIHTSELAEDIVNLVSSFLDQFELSEARLRIDLMRSQPCPKFHCDNLNVRLVTTYLGPATEYQFAGETTTHKAPLNGLVFLKGRLHSTHRDSVHHRSPEVASGEKRLCVAIDY